MTRVRIGRRRFIGLALAGGSTALLAACGQQAPTTAPKPAEAPKPAATAPAAAKPAEAAKPTVAAKPAEAAKPAAAATPAQAVAPIGVQRLESRVITTMPASFKEAPMLAALVKEGKLPPVQERLPAEPLVLKPWDEIGQYGGTYRDGERGNRWGTGFASNEHIVNHLRPLLNISPDLESIEPGVAKEYKVSDDKTTYTLTLRKGMKWSDGEPFTSKDILFWYEDVLLNKELTPSISSVFRPGDKVMEVTAPDDQTIVFKFAVPHPHFIVVLAHRLVFWGLGDRPMTPAHYLKQFHIKYNPQATEQAKAEKYETWFARFQDRDNPDLTVDRPTLRPFKPVSDSPSVARHERNPYFWAVDAEGNQLPYIDVLECEHLANNDLFAAKVVTGAYDFGAITMSITNYPAYEAGAKAGNYRVLLPARGNGTEVYYQVNLTSQDPVLRKIFQDVRFRRALSLGINRNEINDLIYYGRAVPRQQTVVAWSKYFKPEYETAWAQHDPEQGNKLLDEIGLQWDNARKWRLRPDGQQLKLHVDQPLGSVPAGPITELVSKHWTKIGIELEQKEIAQNLLAPRIVGNQQDMSLWLGTASSDFTFPFSAWWLIGNGRSGMEATFAILWNQWIESGGTQGEEPPDWWKDHVNNYLEFQKTLDPALAEKVLKFQAENLVSIGTVGAAPHPMIARTNLRNIPDGLFWSADTNFMAPYHSELWYFKK